jgi:hypothetical protein
MVVDQGGGDLGDAAQAHAPGLIAEREVLGRDLLRGLQGLRRHGYQ